MAAVNLLHGTAWAEFDRAAAPFLAKHCAGCHNAKKAEGDLDLTARYGIAVLAGRRGNLSQGPVARSWAPWGGPKGRSNRCDAGGCTVKSRKTPEGSDCLTLAENFFPKND